MYYLYHNVSIGFYLIGHFEHFLLVVPCEVARGADFHLDFSNVFGYVRCTAT